MPENDTLPCPGCHTPLPPEATGCQICMRSRTKQEIMRGYAKLRENKARKQRLPFQILAVVLVLGGGGKLLVTYRDPILTAARSLKNAVTRWSDDMRDPKKYISTPQDAPAAPSATPAAPPPVAPENALRSKLFPPDSPQSSTPAPAQEPAPAAAQPAGPQPLVKNAWRVTGTVYDLATLAPVPNVDVVFLVNEKKAATTTTDETGTYEIDLNKGDGWAVSANAPNRRRGQILDIDPPYRVRDGDERRAVFEHITDGDLAPAQVNWKRTSSRVHLDLIVVPRDWTDASPR